MPIAYHPLTDGVETISLAISLERRSAFDAAYVALARELDVEGLHREPERRPRALIHGAEGVTVLVPSREDAFVSHFRFLVDPLSLLAVEHQDKTGEFYMEKACSDAASLMPADPREDELTRDCESATDHHTDEREDVGELRRDQHRQNVPIGWIAARLADLIKGVGHPLQTHERRRRSPDFDGSPDWSVRVR
jgi:hypothetical protein